MYRDFLAGVGLLSGVRLMGTPWFRCAGSHATLRSRAHTREEQRKHKYIAREDIPLACLGECLGGEMRARY